MSELLPVSGAEESRITVTSSEQSPIDSPVVEIQDETPEETGDISDTSTDESAEEAEKQKPPKGVQKRLDELTREKYEERRRADAIQAQLERTIAIIERQSGAEKPVQHDVNAAPDPENYPEGDADISYIRDMARYEVRQEFEAQRALAERQKVVSEIEAREAEAKARYADYSEVVTDKTLYPITQKSPQLLEVIATHENGPDIAYYLGKNPKVALELAGMNPYHAAIKIGQILNTVTQPKSVTKSVPKAPPPVERIESIGAAPAASVEAKLAELEAIGTAEAYDKWRALKRGLNSR